MNTLILNNTNLKELFTSLSHIDKEIEEVENLSSKVRSKINEIFWELIELNNKRKRKSSK